jgi:hypothetical protein
MALAHTIEFAELEDLYLDPLNPRLGRANSGASVTQSQVLERMRGWSLEELAVSFLENGFWPQEAVIVVKESLYGPPEKLVVVEGNRRIASLKYLEKAMSGEQVPRNWRRMCVGATPSEDLFTKIPYIFADSRNDVTAFLGYRHVTGIKEWNPAEKAEFIARMVDERGMSYDAIRRQIGSRVDTVRRSYIAFRILEQIESQDIEISDTGMENRFSVLFLSLRESGVQDFLGINIRAEPEDARTPVPEERLGELSEFGKWLFGTEDRRPIFTDSREVGNFARILSSTEAVEYLRSSPNFSFELALQKAGIEDEEIEIQLKEASNQIELALSRVHLHLESEPIQKAVERLALNAKELLSKFPSITSEAGIRIGEATDA